MIASLRGSVLERHSEGSVLIEVAGVGYLVSVTPRTLAELEPTSPVFLFVHHHIREDSQTLFGFLTRDEKNTFQVLLGTHGVGPSLAMAILGTLTPSALFEVVASADIGALTLVPGVGKKTAERLLIELKSRLSLPVFHDSEKAHSSRSSVVSDVREALLGLGYTDSEIREVLRELPAVSGAETLLRDALQMLGVRRAG
ncbi:MAG: Holliday junction branch migration protein RuvA [Actinomycetes bacterium]